MWLLMLKLIGFANILHCINVCRNTCNDGGCDYTDNNGTYKGCDCRFSKDRRTGDNCEHFVNACEMHTYPPCRNGGKCVPSLDFSYCDCPIDYIGPQCNYHRNSEYHDWVAHLSSITFYF